MGKTYSYKLFFTLFILVSLCLIFSPKNTLAAEKQLSSSATFAKEEIIVSKKDIRVEVIKRYLESYNSPLASFAKTFISAADKYELDWKLLVAIAGVESTFGKNIPYNSYNAWGWGIYGNNIIRFTSYDEAIETISKELKERYIDKWGTKDVYEIGRYYAASPTWASGVTHFMQKIDDFSKKEFIANLSISI